MFKKIMASLGVGAAKVDLLLDDEHYRIGDELRGKMLIEGGNTDQGIRDIKIDVVIKVFKKGELFKEEAELIKEVLNTIKVADNLTVKARDKMEIPFSCALPLDYPISKRNIISYYLRTKMDIAKALDAFDSDEIIILPSREMEQVFYALDELGFKEKPYSGEIDLRGQEFEYYPPSSLADMFKEVELRFYHSLEGALNLLWELELKDGSEYFAGQVLKHDVFSERTSVKNEIKEFLSRVVDEIATKRSAVVKR
ncbi:sporulation protein [Peptococcaceae bacterium]|nr:sporulation protein [Peptococcaceae bacterium]